MNILHDLPHYAWYVAPAFLSLITVVVFFHELGHFVVGRLFGVKVETFSIGFGRALVKWHDRHGTLWKIGWMPFGGYVKFFGDADSASTPDREATARMSAADRAVSLPYKPLWQRALVVGAGPVANFILAIVILTAMFAIRGEVSVPPVVGAVTKNSPAAQAGIKTGDRIVAVDGEEIASYSDVSQIVSMSAGQRLPITIDRGTGRFTVFATPVESDLTDNFGNRMRGGDLGFVPFDPPVVDQLMPDNPAEKAGLRRGDRFVSVDGHKTPLASDVQQLIKPNPGKRLVIVVVRDGKLLTILATPIRNKDGKGLLGFSFAMPRIVTHMGPATAFGESLDTIGHIVTTTFRALFHSSQGIRQVSGFIGIAKVSGEVAAVSLADLIMLAALLSVSIGLVNLFPIPLLDGGHLLYYACEAVLGRPLGERAQDVGFRVGLAVVAGIFLLATWNDILNLF